MYMIKIFPALNKIYYKQTQEYTMCIPAGKNYSSFDIGVINSKQQELVYMLEVGLGTLRGTAKNSRLLKYAINMQTSSPIKLHITTKLIKSCIGVVDSFALVDAEMRAWSGGFKSNLNFHLTSSTTYNTIEGKKQSWPVKCTLLQKAKQKLGSPSNLC